MRLNHLSSRERVLKTLNHQEPDRIPFNLNLTAEIYHSLRDYLGLPKELDIPMDLGTVVSPSLDLLDEMRVDFCYVKLGNPRNWKQPSYKDETTFDEWGVGYRKIRRPGGFYFEISDHPLAGAAVEDIDRYPWPIPNDPGRIDGLREKVDFLRNSTDKAIIAKFSTSLWEQAWYLRGLEQWMVDLVENPEIVCRILDQLCLIAMGMVKVGLDAVGEDIDILRLSGEDLGTQIGPMISLKMYEKYLKPRFGRLWAFSKTKLQQKNPEGKLMLHSCGNIRPFIRSWIEMGLDVLDPIQPRAIHMEPKSLKQEYGNRLVFHGGIDIQHTLPFGTPEEVTAEVKRYIETLGPGGGYIVAPAHNVQNDVPPANLVAIRDAINRYGNYPINEQE